MRGMMAAGALVALVGCGHTESSTEARTADSSWEQAKSSFANAFDAVKSGTKESATAGKYALKDFGNGVVRVTDESKEAVERSSENVTDAWITTKVKSKLTLDKSIKADHLAVTTDHGVVHLYGLVEDPAAAERAIDKALDTKGVKAVDAQLDYRRPV